ncbi:MAG: hypothetical protein ACRDHW_02305, partial [Ktedonobacteraceae bacterium]
TTTPPSAHPHYSSRQSLPVLRSYNHPLALIPLRTSAHRPMVDYPNQSNSANGKSRNKKHHPNQAPNSIHKTILPALCLFNPVGTIPNVIMLTSAISILIKIEIRLKMRVTHDKHLTISNKVIIPNANNLSIFPRSIIRVNTNGFSNLHQSILSHQAYSNAIARTTAQRNRAGAGRHHLTN